MRLTHDGNEQLSIDLATFLSYMQCNKLNGRTTTAGQPVPIAASDVRPNGDRHAYDFDLEEEHPPLGSRAQHNPRTLAVVGSRFGRFGHCPRRNPLRCEEARSGSLNSEFLWPTSLPVPDGVSAEGPPSLFPHRVSRPPPSGGRWRFWGFSNLRRAIQLLSAAFRTLMSRP